MRVEIGELRRLHIWPHSFISILILLVCISGQADALPGDETGPNRRVTIDQQYFVGQLSPRAVSEFHLNILMLQGLSIDIVVDAAHTLTPESSEFFAPLLGFLLRGFYHFYFTEPGMNAMHLSGTAFRQNAGGLNTKYYTSAKGSPRRPDGQTMRENYFAFLWDNIKGRFSDKNKPGFSIAGGNYTFSQKPVRNNMLVAMGGANAGMYFAEYIAKDLRYKNGHLSHFSGYISGRFDNYSYAENAPQAKKIGAANDLVDINNFYKKRGIKFRYTEVQEATILTFLMSGTTLSFLRSTFVRSYWGKPVQPLVINDIIFPDIYYYLTTRGPSYKVTGGFLTEKLAYPYSIERTQGTNPATEIQLGTRYFSPTHQAEILFLYSSLSKALGIKFYGEYFIYGNEKFAIKLWGGLTRYAPGSLQAEREMPGVRPQLVDTIEGIIGISIEY
ncbi:MAG: hypothetical protein ABUK01_17660 [Leptospirales bacterium]